MSWGLFPDEVLAQLKKREWDNLTNLRKRLLDERPFPIHVSLKPPSGARALKDMSRFQNWIASWGQWPAQQQLTHEQRSYRQIGSHRVPTTLTLSSMQELATCLGGQCVARSARWGQIMAPFLALDEGLHLPLVQNLETLESLSEGDAKLLAQTLPQLQPGMATGIYLRALPMRGVDTKFVETHHALITALLDTLHGNAVSAAGGLRSWIGARNNPKDWLHVRPLCADTQKHLAGLSILRLPSDVLMDTPLPASQILIVENVQSGLALPEIQDTIAVFGGGANVTWTATSWLADKQVAYWGDIDTWGLKFLNDARQRVSTLRSVMMDLATLERFMDRTVIESGPWSQELPALDGNERALYERLLSDVGGVHRLEQERLDADYVYTQLQIWGNEMHDA